MAAELARIPLFARASAAELAGVAAIARREALAAATVLFFEGDRGDALYVVLSGSVKVYKTHDDGQERILNTMGAGEIVGELAILDDEPRSASVATLEPTEVLSIRRQEFRALVGRQPELLWHVVEALSARIRDAGRKAVSAAFETIPFRVVSALVTLAEKHGTSDADGGRSYRIACDAVRQSAGTDAPSTERVMRLLVSKQLARQEGDTVVIDDLFSLTRAREYAREWT